MSRNISDLHPELQIKLNELKAKCEANGLKIGISECFRTVAEQDALYAQGRTTKGSIVTNAKGSSYSSMHQWGVAFDFYRNDGQGAYNESGNFFNRVGAIGESIGLEWGGHWKSIIDKPHFQLPNWGSTATKLKTLYGTPDKFIQTWKSGTPLVSESAKNNTSSQYTKTQFIKDVQTIGKVTVDGIAGPKTLGSTVTISRTQNNRHPLVKPVQKYLYSLGYTEVGTADGIAGKNFEKAIINYQTKVVHLTHPDGELTAGKNTWKALLGLK